MGQILYYNYWIVRAEIERDWQQDAVDSQANGCQAVHGWDDKKIIAYREENKLDPPLQDGWIYSEPYEEQVTKIDESISKEEVSGDYIKLDFSEAKNLSLTIHVDHDITFVFGGGDAGNRITLIIINDGKKDRFVQFEAATTNASGKFIALGQTQVIELVSAGSILVELNSVLVAGP